MSFFCCLLKWSIIRSFHMSNVLGEERRVPSPEQGASRRILSNLNPVFSSFAQRAIASILVTMVLVAPQRSRFAARIFILSSFISLAMSVPLFCIAAAICVVFEPGEAQRSRTNSSGWGERARTDIMEQSS